MPIALTTSELRLALSMIFDCAAVRMPTSLVGLREANSLQMTSTKISAPPARAR
ncbi:hypothetical protein D3C73_1001810 [compost metagenome]